jgi:hypothetical protein
MTPTCGAFIGANSRAFIRTNRCAFIRTQIKRVVVQSLPTSTVVSLQDSTSHQHRAFEWVTEYNRYKPSDEETSLIRMTQRFALATLFHSVSRSSQISSTTSECLWDSVQNCDSDYEVVALDPDGYGGTIPREIGLLTRLT